MNCQRNNTIPLIALLVLTKACYSQFQSESRTPEVLSIEKSLLPIFSDRYYTSDDFPFNRINPDAKEYIYFYLEKDNVRAFGGNAIALLGYIGDKDDILFVDKYIQDFLAHPDREERLLNMNHIAFGAGCFSGITIKRKIEGARSFFERYATTSAWIRPGDDPEMIRKARYAYSVFMIRAYHFSKEDYVFEALQAKSTTGEPFRHESELENLRKLEEDLYTVNMKPVKMSARKLNESLDRDLKEAIYIKLVMNKQSYAQWREAQERQRVGPEAERETPVPFESVDMSETIEGAYLRGVARDAAEALQKVSRMFIDSGAKNLPIREDIFRAIYKAGLNTYSGFQVKVDMEARINDFVPDIKSGDRENAEGAAGPVVVRNGEAATVTFSIQGAAESQDVTIRMERENGKWHWSPSADPRVDAAAEIVDEKYLIESVRAAVVAYAQISRTLLDGNYDPLTIPVVDDGKLIPLEKRRRDKVKITEVLELEKRILEELTDAKLNAHGDHQITVRFEGTLGPAQTGAETDVMSVPVKGYEIADVRFTIRNGAEAYRKHAPERSGEGCFDGAGGLRVFMKRINGKWYWNPFRLVVREQNRRPQ